MTRVAKCNRIFAVMTSLLVAVSWSAAAACSPGSLTPKEIIESADIIVIANATKSKWAVSEYEPGVMRSFIDFFRRFAPDDDTPSEGKTEFKIRRTLKGAATGHITIRHDVSPSAYGITFNSYENYLLFVYEHKKKYVTNVFGVRPYLSAAEHKELVEMLDVRADDHVKFDNDYLEPVDAR